MYFTVRVRSIPMQRPFLNFYDPQFKMDNLNFLPIPAALVIPTVYSSTTPRCSGNSYCVLQYNHMGSTDGRSSDQSVADSLRIGVESID